MNLQNVPEGDEDDEESKGLPNVRKLFITDEVPEPMEFFDIDLDSADLRIVTWESDCKLMKQWLAEGKKPYVEVAKEYFQDDSINKEHDAYKAFKVICHGSNYAGGAGEIFNRMPKSAKVEGLTESRIEKIQKWYFEKFPEIKDWHEIVKAKLYANRYVENIFGYRIWCFDRLEGNVVKEAIAAIPQSSIACLINRGYKNIHDNNNEIQVLLQVHDSLSGQYPIRSREACREAIKKQCTILLPYKEPLIIPVGIKTSTISWGDCQ